MSNFAKEISLYWGQIMLVHCIFCESVRPFLSAASVFPLYDVSWLPEWSDENVRLEWEKRAAQFESPSATGFSFPLPLLSVGFVSSFVLLCLDGERVHAVQHVMHTLLSESVSRHTSFIYTCCKYTICLQLQQENYSLQSSMSLYAEYTA